MTLVHHDFRRAEPAARLKIVILNDSSFARGGATGLALKQARLLRARGHDVTFISGDRGDFGDLTAHGVQTFSLGGKLLLDESRLKAAGRGIYNKAAARRISDFIAANDTDRTIYHLHGWSRILSPSVFDALRPVARRTFLHAHDFFLACPNGVYFDYARQQVCTRTPMSAGCLATQCDKRNAVQKGWRVLRQASLKRALGGATDWAGVMMIHPAMAPGLLRAGLDPDLLKIARNPAAPLVPSRIRAEENRSFCYLGQSMPGKGVEMLCRAARIAGVPLKIIGDVSQRPGLRRSFPEVTFTGWVDQAEIGDHLQDVRALVMPSRFTEPFGLVAAEASLSGLPLVVSKTAMLASEVEQLGLGHRADASTPEALAAALTRMAELPDAEVRTISRRGHGRDAVLSQTDSDWLDGMLNMYREALLTRRAVADPA